MIPDSFIQDLLARVDIVDVIERYVPLKKGGANYSARCPFHNEKSPSFTVSPTKQFYYCFGCGAKGSAIGFIMEYAGLGFREAVAELAAGIGLKVPEDDPTGRRPDGAKPADKGAADLYDVMLAASDFYRAELKKSTRAIEYLKGRGLTGEIAARFRIGYAPDGWTPLANAFPDYKAKSLLDCGLVKEPDDDDSRSDSRSDSRDDHRRGEPGDTATPSRAAEMPAHEYASQAHASGSQNRGSDPEEQASDNDGDATHKPASEAPDRQKRRYDRFRDRIMFPIINQRGQIIGFGGRVLDKGEPKYLNSPETPIFDKGRELYGLPQARLAIRETGTVVVVEGYMDVVALAQMGVANCVAALGTATTPAHVQKLMKQADRIIFCFDGDTAGRKAAWRALENSLPLLADDRHLSFVFLPQGEDPDSFVRKNGNEAFLDLQKHATPLSQYLLDHLATGLALQTPEGRSQLQHAAKPLLLQIAAPGLRLQLFKRVAELSGVTQAEIEALYSARASVATRPAAPALSQPRGKRAHVTRNHNQLLQIVALQPALASKLDMSLFDRESEVGAAAHALTEWIANSDADEAGPRQTPAMLFEHFRGSVVEAYLGGNELEDLRDSFNESEMLAEFNNLQVALRCSRYQDELDGLTAKSSNARLSREEDLRFMQLLGELESLKRTQSSPN